MSRASNILHENREIIDNMMKQMDDFADAHGGYINRSGVGNFRTKPVEEEDKGSKKMDRGRRQARAAGLAGAGLGAAYLAAKSDPEKMKMVKHGLTSSGKAIKGAWKTATDSGSPTGGALRAAGKAVKTAAKHYGIGN